MAYNTKAIKTDVNGNPISQYYNPETDEYEPVEGAGGGNKVIIYNEDGTPNNSLNFGEILDKLDQLTGTVIAEQYRQQNEAIRQQNEQQRIDLYNTLKDLDVSQYEPRLQEAENNIENLQGDLNSHLEDTNNPHNITPDQIGALKPEDLTKNHIIEALGYTPIDANVFPGIIVMWSGNIEDLPDGWVLCDGRNGTPDLRDRFILGADGTDIGDTGGSHTKTIAIDNLPPHSHTFTTNNDGKHRHIGRSKAFSMSANPNGWHVLRRAVSEDSYDGTSNIIHSDDGNHTHSGTTDTTGKGEAIDIRPKYYKLAFIMYKG